MELRVVCPNDGRVDVPVHNLSAILVYGTDTVDLVLTCPVCGEDIHLRARIPDLIVSMMEAVEELEQCPHWDRPSPRAPLMPPAEEPWEDARTLGYVEYFRRQLERADTVDAMLAEIDSR